MKRAVISRGFFLVLILLTQVVSGPALGGEQQRVSIKQLSIAEEGQWPPYTYESEGIPTKGLSLDLMMAVFSKLGIDVHMQLYPQKRMLQYAADGRVDLISTISINEKRKKYLEFTVPIVKDRGLIWYLAQRTQPITWQRFEDLRPYRIGVVEGYNYGDTFEQALNVHRFMIDSVTRSELNLFKLAAGRVDLVLAQQSTMSELLRKYPEHDNNIVSAEKPYITYLFHMGFSKKSPARVLIPLVNDAIRQLQNDGTIPAILSKYGMKP